VAVVLVGDLLCLGICTVSRHADEAATRMLEQITAESPDARSGAGNHHAQSKTFRISRCAKRSTGYKTA